MGLLNVFLFVSDHIYEALLYSDIDINSLEPDSILYEDSIKLIVKKSGMKYKSAKLREEKERENKDAVKRWAVNHSSLFFSACLFLQGLFVYCVFFQQCVDGTWCGHSQEVCTIDSATGITCDTDAQID